jgi:RNA polymerase sigma-70 factor (ECF subfamily)
MQKQQAAVQTEVETISSAPNSAYAGDLAIAQEIAAGNRALFKEVYERNANTLFNLARRMADSAAEAEDIVQDAFIRAYQKIHLFAGRSTLSSWLYRICVNVGLENLRRKKGTFEDINDSNCGTAEPDQKKVILRRKLEKAIKRLPHGCRTVFVLHDIEGFNHKEIAARLNLAEGTSKSQLFKARAMLRKILTGQES